MILRAIQTNDSAFSNKINGSAVPAWDAVIRTQQHLQAAKECWLVPQPAHAALSGDIAAKLSSEAFGALDATTVRAIALHDAGWGPPDAVAIQASRAASGVKGGTMPLSFIAAPANEAADAWNASIDTAEKVNPVGGYMVSEHFRSIALNPMVQAKGSPAISKFIANEEARQKKLRPKIKLADAELQRLVDGLRFCDLLSLYLSCGAQESIEFPQAVAGKPILLTRTAENECSMAPFPFTSDQIFSISAIRHPKPKGQSSSVFYLKVTG
ncbi:MAG: hypothetical protein JWO13_578 [Acidobacteriales bacterium]|nr:hypothetical protein [Terriglobales bacterium]